MPNHQIQSDAETLLGAAQSGNLANMRKLLCKGQDPNSEGMFNFSYNDGSRVYNGMTTQGLAAIYFAIANNQEAMVDLLIKYGLKLDARNYSHTNPLEAATLARSVAMIKKCLEHGAHVDVKNHYGKTALYVAADENLLEVVDLLLKNGACPDVQENELNWGALHKAVFHGNIKIVKRLIEAGADVNLLTSDHDTPLHMAAWKNHADVAKLLIEAGAKVNIGRKDNQTPLFVASAYHNPEVAYILLENGANVNAKDNHGRTALHNVATTKNIEFAKALVSNGANMSVKNNSGDTPVHLAALKGQLKMLRFLQKKGADLAEKGWGGCTALHDAAAEGHTDVVRLILKIKSDKKFIDLADNGEMTALGSSVTRDSKEIAELLLNAGANPNIRYRTEMKNTILHWAAFNNSKNCMKLLLNRRLLSVDETNLQGTTPLHVAAMKGYIDLMKMLLNYGADPTCETSEGDNLLHLALIEGRTEVVRFILESDISYKFFLNAENGRGSTPISIACEKRNIEAVELLLKAGADASRCNKHGRCALHYAAGHGDLKIGKLLVKSLRHHQREEFINRPTKEGWTSLHMAAEFQHLEFVRWLLSNGADVSSRSIDGYTPLHMAVKKNSPKLLEMLLSHGADLDAKTKLGATALHVASACGSTSVVEMLLSLVPEQLEAKEKPHNATPLISALSQGNSETACVLLENGANVNSETNIWHDTPLDFASHSGLMESVRKLINGKGGRVGSVNVNHVGLMGRTALHWAAISGNPDIIIELLRHGVDPYKTDIYGFSALELATQQKKDEAASILRWWPSHFKPLHTDLKKSESIGEETPDRFICPITQVIMTDPVYAVDGFAYEKTVIKKWLEQSSLSPMTRRKLSNNDLVPAFSLKQDIENYTNNLKNL